MNLKISKYNKRAILGGIIATLIVGTGSYMIGNLSGYEAKKLIENSLPGINVLCNTIVLASATILALLLTLLSLSSSMESKLNALHYRQVLFLAKFDTVVFVVSMVAFQLFNLPLTETDTFSDHWYITFYYITLSMSSLLSGGLISVVLMLYNTVASIIKIVGLGVDDHRLLKRKDED